MCRCFGPLWPLCARAITCLFWPLCARAIACHHVPLCVGVWHASAGRCVPSCEGFGPYWRRGSMGICVRREQRPALGGGGGGCGGGGWVTVAAAMVAAMAAMVARVPAAGGEQCAGGPTAPVARRRSPIYTAAEAATNGRHGQGVYSGHRHGVYGGHNRHVGNGEYRSPRDVTDTRTLRTADCEYCRHIVNSLDGFHQIIRGWMRRESLRRGAVVLTLP